MIYRGLDRYTEDEVSDTASIIIFLTLPELIPQVGVFVAKIRPGGQSQRAGLRENDKILKINNKVGLLCVS